MTPKEIAERITADGNCDFIEDCKDCPLVLACNVTEECIWQTANAYLLGYEQGCKDTEAKLQPKPLTEEEIKQIGVTAERFGDELRRIAKEGM